MKLSIKDQIGPRCIIKEDGQNIYDAIHGTPDFYRHVIAEVPEVAKIVEALEEMIDLACKVDSWESFPSGPIERAEDAIRAYRAQCGN